MKYDINLFLLTTSFGGIIIVLVCYKNVANNRHFHLEDIPFHKTQKSFFHYFRKRVGIQYHCN